MCFGGGGGGSNGSVGTANGASIVPGPPAPERRPPSSDAPSGVGTGLLPDKTKTPSILGG